MTATKARSIQGERAAAKAQIVWATEADIFAYAQNCSEGVATCRGRGRHAYDPMPSPPRFTRIREDGLLEAESGCNDCGCVTQVQVWEAFTQRIGKKNVPGVRPLFSYPIYHKNDLGEEYISKFGRIPRKVFRQARVSATLDDEALRWVQKALKQQNKYARENRSN